ncbi:O-Antigen ligase [Croceibacterium atlanticum]|uniref:O-Antigen ligase n=2 Tax=Croceibacterium atlanticum TaxID=1267766 RepID=A0A0F7KVD1_9SPHN|nr:DUF5935 domain-containing protein [Croceibacterium atlanticum]AKH43136.1 O-Antigen ligase [Croceibacterium atlanticum]
MLDLALFGFFAILMLLGLRRPFIWVLAYLYVDIVAPQKIGWSILPSLPVSLIAFLAAFGGWLLLDNKKGGCFTFRQALILVLLLYCGMTTIMADFPEAAQTKWSWVWKALLFAIFLPLTLRTRLRLEAAALFMVLSAGSIIISGGIKTLLSGGGYGTLAALVQENSGLYEGSTLSTVAIAIIPLTIWVARNGTIFPASRWTMGFALALCFAALLIPIGTQTRTGLLCIGLLAALTLRSVKYKFVYMGLGALALLAAIPFLPASYTERMSTISNHQADQSASTRLAVWQWTVDYAKENPLGGGFDAFLGNSFTYSTRVVVDEGGSREVRTEQITEEARAYHSAYFEMLGEQGWPGLFLWLWLQGLGLWQMERIRRRYRTSDDPQEKSWRGLATALQHGQLIYLLGALFIGIAYQPFVFMLIGLQIGLMTLVSRRITARKEEDRKERLASRRAANAGMSGDPDSAPA